MPKNACSSFFDLGVAFLLWILTCKGLVLHTTWNSFSKTGDPVASKLEFIKLQIFISTCSFIFIWKISTA